MKAGKVEEVKVADGVIYKGVLRYVTAPGSTMALHFKGPHRGVICSYVAVGDCVLIRPEEGQKPYVSGGC